MLVTDDDTKRAAIGHVVAVVGSLTRTAPRFGVSVAELKAWLEGNSEVPKAPFLAAVEFLLNTSEAELETAKKVIERSDLPAMTAYLESLLEQRRN